ncbi:MAG: phospholipase D family protein, partial [Flavobacteriales bacterium]|nr:phospholipase D family protein [Flavobacteriales bacterium]
NKTFIVDGQVAITGGRNIADEYFDYDHEYNFRDRDVLLLGKAVSSMNTSFDDFWSSSLSIPAAEVDEETTLVVTQEATYAMLHEYACDPDNFWPQVREKLELLPKAFQTIKENGKLAWVDDVEFISDLPGKNDGSQGLGGGGVTTTALINLINQAEKSIDIQTPYLITTALSQGLFLDAVQRGVKVRILTNSLASTDNLEAFSAYQSDREALLETGVEIYEFRPDAASRLEFMTGALHTTLEDIPTFGLHAKSMVVDSQISVIGTFNFDPRSANLNTECIAVIHSPVIASNVLNSMEVDFQSENSWRITPEFNPDANVGNLKRFKTWTRKVLPKGIL